MSGARSGAAEPDSFPASVPQEQMWILAQLQPDLAICNITMYLPLPIGCDEQGARQALTRVVQRHESLRTSFSLAAGHAVPLRQVVQPTIRFDLPLTDLREVPTGQREGRFEEVAQRDAAVPFDLGRPPLWRARLVRLTDSDVRLVWTCHHALFDGVSARIFVHEFLESAHAVGEQSQPRLAELPLQYADYAVWQRNQLTEDRLAVEEAYWRTTLAGLPPDLGLPTDLPRPAQPSHQGGVYQFDFTAELTARVQGWSQEARVTPFTTLLAAFLALLARWTGNRDVYVGCPLAGRTEPRFAPLIGMFVYPAVIRADLDGDPTFADMVRRVCGRVFDALDHQPLPGRTPHYQVSFNLVPVQTHALIHNGTVMDELALDLSLHTGRLHGRLEYAADLFNVATARRLAGAYLRLVDAAVSHPDMPVSRLPA